MKLIYTSSNAPVLVGDKVRVGDEMVVVDYFRPPHKPSSSGKITVRTAEGWTREFYVGVIGAKWVDREDQPAFTTGEL
jgi:hypothetical protein